MTRTTTHVPNIDRYYFDFKACHFSRGYAQIDTDQDACYYGMWTNPTKRVTIEYCEGDVSTQTYETDAEYTASLKWLAEEFGAFKGIDPACRADLIDAFEALGVSDLLH